MCPIVSRYSISSNCVFTNHWGEWRGWCNCVCQLLMANLNSISCSLYFSLINELQLTPDNNKEMTLSLCLVGQLSPLTLLPPRDRRRLHSAATVTGLLGKHLIIHTNPAFQTWYLKRSSIFTLLQSHPPQPRFSSMAAESHYSSCDWWSPPPSQQLPYLCQLQATPLPPSLPHSLHYPCTPPLHAAPWFTDGRHARWAWIDLQ